MAKVLIYLAFLLFVNNAAAQRLRNSFTDIIVLIMFIYTILFLEQYNVDPSSITVSGISSGAAMATQFHFAHSTQVNGAGIVAGGSYLYIDGQSIGSNKIFIFSAILLRYRWPSCSNSLYV